MLLLLLSFLLDLSALNLLSKCVGNPVQNLRMFSNPFKQLSDGAWEILRRNYESFKINSNNSERYVENSSQIPWLVLVVLLYRSAWWVVGHSSYCCCCYCYSCYCCYSSLLDKNICICIFVHGGSNCVALFLPANYIPSDSTRPKELKPLHRVQGIPTQ